MISTYLGSRLEDLHPTDPLVIGSLLLVVSLMLAVRWLGRSTAPKSGEDVAGNAAS